VECGSAKGVAGGEVGVVGKDGVEEREGADGGSEHGEGLAGGGEGEVEAWVDLGEEGGGSSGGALGHLHALQPHLR
jgi:hypothetical protein